MLASMRSSLAILLVQIFCLIGSAPAYSQSAAFFNAPAALNNRTSSRAWLAKCAAASMNTLAAWRSSTGSEWPAAGNGTTSNSNVASLPVEVCLEAAPAVQPRGRMDIPCRQDMAGAAGVPPAFPCSETDNTVPAEIAALGRAGLKIARAREIALDILRSENACTSWFETKDATPAETFRSLLFLVDRHGPEDIFASIEDESTMALRQPYVAQATQDGGAHTAITINAHGAFYRPQGQVQKASRDGGPVQMGGTRLLTVGIYTGDTLRAQIVTLLHEFGHIIDLLPEDADNLDGRSVRNTNEVLRHCRDEVEARAQQAKPMAKR